MKNLSRATAIVTLAIAATAASAGTALAAPTDNTVWNASAATQFENVSADVTGAAVVPAAATAGLDRGAAIDGAVAATLGAFNSATNDSKLIAGGVGAAVGCAIGAVTGGTLTVLTTAGALSPIGVVGGCILGGVTVGGLATVIAGAAGLPAAIGTAIDQYNQLHANGFVSAPGPLAQ